MGDLIERLERLANLTVESPAPHLTGDMKFYVYDAETRNTIHEAIAALSQAQQPGVVEVKPLEWSERWSGGQEDIPSWFGNNPLGLYVAFSFAGKYDIKWHREAPADEVEAMKAAEQAKYDQRVRSALYAAPPLVPVGEGEG